MSILDIFHKKAEPQMDITNTILYRAYYSGTRLKTKNSIEHFEDVVEFRYSNTLSPEQVHGNITNWIESHGIIIKDFVLKRIDE